jgi:hypothetical protein
MSVSRVAACSCGVLNSPPGKCIAPEIPALSFVGTVIDIENPPDERRGADQSDQSGESGVTRYRFRIDENLGGFDSVKEVDVYSGRGGSDCSYHFALGVSYIVEPWHSSATYKSAPNQWIVTVCSGTRPSAGAEELIKTMKLRKSAAFVIGVVRSDPPSLDYFQELNGVSVTLRGKDFSRTTTTDAHNAYQFLGVPAGTYSLEVKLPEDLLPSPDADRAPTVTITDKSCHEKILYAVPKSRWPPR